ncbi:MAG TPA: preprotein translocase subunit Sec61beta [Methanocella sp.]|nr:preprotein translocase subunit Sec61beta [Methanocella sp.]
MAKSSDRGTGLMSSAGLMRYFEAEESAIKIDPKTVVIAGVVLGVLIELLNATYGHIW